jgi:soluble lytic murein transglycosylase
MRRPASNGTAIGEAIAYFRGAAAPILRLVVCLVPAGAVPGALLPAGALFLSAGAMAQSPAARDAHRVKGGAQRPREAKAEGAPVQRSAPIPPVAAPTPPAEEAAHLARYDAAIAAVRDYALPAQEAAALRAAVAAGAAGRLAETRAARERLADPAAQKLVDWYLYRGGYGGPSEIRAFLEANPAWPDRNLLQQRAEEALFRANAAAKEVNAFFAKAPPSSAAGLAALAAAHLADGREAEARALAAKAWCEGDLAASLEATFVGRLGRLLTPADHKRRLDRLLAQDVRWAGERNQRAAVVRRLIPLLAEADRKMAEARLAVFLRAKNSQALLAKLPAPPSADWGYAEQKAQALRRAKHAAEALNVLLAAPPAGDEVKPDGWWEERRVNAYAALKLGKAKEAYELAAKTGPLSVNATKDAAFLAGWLALRQLGDARLALGHFQRLAAAADGPLSHARGEYWLGRTYEALGDQESGKAHYRLGARYVDTFHGQLSRLKLDPSARSLKIPPPAAPSPEEIASFNASDAVKAAVIAKKASLDGSVARIFLSQLRVYLSSEAEVAMLAHLAQALGEPQVAVRIGKSAIANGMNLIYYSYPTQALPQYTPLRRPPEAAFILGIARQESEFDITTLSGAGARGILQVMPVTARHVCHDYKITCDLARLMRDPAYNTMMGSAYIADRMQEFGGSYVLTLAGYNAGPGRAREWIKEFGDPRDGKIDVIDWIHRIPLEETREYVQKVLSNIQIYRARLGDEANALRLTADLKGPAAAEDGRRR